MNYSGSTQTNGDTSRMPKPLSNDLRKRIIEAKLRGDTEDKIAAEKEVNKSTITKLWALYRKTGSYEARPNPNGRKPALSAEQLERIARKINGQPDVTLQEPIDDLGLPVCMWRSTSRYKVDSMVIHKLQAILVKYFRRVGKPRHQSSSSGMSGLMMMAWGGVRSAPGES